ncbi:hypothetical protein BKG97_04395 [Rodentibacter caecimuris]|nr:hypothetical protein BKG97_04395 [Rodentibacter heylii]
MHCDKNVAEVSDMLGFQEHTHFVKFKKSNLLPQKRFENGIKVRSKFIGNQSSLKNALGLK